MKEEEWTDRCERYFTSIADNEKKVLSQAEAKSTSVPSVERGERTESEGIYPTLIGWMSLMDLHGTALIGNSKSIPVKVFWLFVCATGLASLSYVISDRVAHYKNAESHFVLVSSDTVEPAVHTPLTITVCNINMLRKSTLRGTRFMGLMDIEDHVDNMSLPFRDLRKDVKEDILKDTKLQKFGRSFKLSSLIESTRGEFEAFRGMLSPTDWEVLYQNAIDGDMESLRRALRLSREELHRHGIRVDDDIVHCWKDGKACTSGEMALHVDSFHGNCLEMNLSTPDLLFEKASLIFNARLEDYLGLFASTVGFKVRVQAGFNESETAEEYFVTPGNKLQLNLRKVCEFRRESCSDGQKNRKQCQEECLDDLTRDLCGCSVSIDAASVDRCRVDHEYQYVCSRVLARMKASGLLPCSCPKNCREHRVTTSGSITPWPSQQHQGHLLKSLHEKGYQGDASSLRAELVQVEITAYDTVYEQYQEKRDVTIFGLLVEVGAFSALICGMSLITCLQLLVGLVNLIFRAYRRAFQRDVPREGVQRLRDADVQTVTWSQKGTSHDKTRHQSTTTFLSTLSPIGQSYLDPINEVDTPRTESHTYEAIYSRISPRDAPCNAHSRSKASDRTFSQWPPSKTSRQWNATDGPSAGRERWKKPSFGSLGKAGFENKVFYGSKDDLNKQFPAADNGTDRMKAIASPRRNSWSERPAIPPLDLTKIENSDGFWMRNGKLVSAEDYFKRSGSGSHVLTSTDFARRYGVPHVQGNIDKTKSKNVFYM
ncbi:uncharacterized protein LOC124136890 [Haliotis rufescens]|uniref:uncharacterized protein LOC124136890 n=1 Tax=Haliotis rufescens TaxID=6454 RepID=UPI00201E9745|nr:uncharacterized protein LOC124136890 [Haliotis rufescens]